MSEVWIFDAVLRPHRSLSARGFVILMAVLCGVSFCAGMVFFLAGAWPVIGFMGLDVALIYIAFKASYRSAALREEVRVNETFVEVVRITPAGRRACAHLPSGWLQVQVEERDHGPGQIRLVSHGRSIIFGKFLTAGERKDLAAALRAALKP